MVRIAQITDMHLDHAKERKFGQDTRANFLRVLEDVRKRDVAELVLTGDLAEKSAVPWLFGTLEKCGVNYSYIPGNHDDMDDYRESDPGAGRKENYHERELADFKLIFLDSGNAVIDGVQLEWLKSAIRDTPKEVAIFVHHPILDCGGSYMDIDFPLKNRDEVLEELLALKRGMSIFCGHYHAIDERKIGDIVQYVAPSTFYQIKKIGRKLEVDDLPIGYRIIEIGKTIRTEVVTLE